MGKRHIISPLIILALLLTCACNDTKKQLQQRAFELCKYIPDHQLLEKSRDYMTKDFYSVLDTMFYRLPEHEAMDHEWLYYFVTGNGGSIADYEVAGVEKTDRTHAIATINVRQVWEDGSFDEETDIEQHQLFMEKVDLISEIAPYYKHGELCIPTLMIVNEENDQVWGDFWVFWYNAAGDTLKCVSGGNHPGLMTLDYKDGIYNVTSFVQVADGAGYTPSAKRIFRDRYDIFCNMHSNQDLREAVRCEQMSEYLRFNNLPYLYYQDYGWPAVKL